MIRIFLPVLFCLSLLAIPAGTQDDPDTIQNELNSREAEQRKLDRERQRLESQIQSRESNIRTLDRTLRIYEINLQEAQQVIDAAQTAIDELAGRAEHRSAILREAMKPIAVPGTPKQESIRDEALRDAVKAIAKSLLMEQEEEAPRLRELKALVAERTAYQERIRTRYMPADAQRKDSYSSRLEQTQVALTTTQTESEQLKEEIAQLQKNLETSQRALEQLAKQREEERRKELERKRRESPTAPPIARATEQRVTAVRPSSPASTTHSTQPFSRQQGTLSWPARGNVVQPFGTFTHHRYNVTINNTGIDVQVPANTALRACANGTVLYSGDLPGIGPTVLVEHDNAYVSIYGNIRTSVAEEQRIRAGEEVGTVISPSGSNTVVYHFAIMQGQQPLNPILWLRP